MCWQLQHTESIDAGQRSNGRRQITGSSIRLVQPPRQQRLQLAHVLEAELERLKPTDGSLREDVAVEGSQSKSHIGLCEAQFDSSLFELASKRFQVVGGWNFVVLVSWTDDGGRRRC